MELTLPDAMSIPGAAAQWTAYRDSMRASAARDWQLSLDNALKGVEQHYAARGLSSSGIREGAIGTKAAETANAMGSAMLGIDQRVLAMMMEQQDREKAYQRDQQRLAEERAYRKSQMDEWRQYQKQAQGQEASMADRMAMQQAFGGGGGFGGEAPGWSSSIWGNSGGGYGGGMSDQEDWRFTPLSETFGSSRGSSGSGGGGGSNPWATQSVFGGVSGGASVYGDYDFNAGPWGYS
mgnify:FL=1